MHAFTVTNVVDGDTFDISPNWSWSGESGNRVRPTHYDAPEMRTIAGVAAKARLTQLILGKMVELGNAYKIDRGRLVCDVYFQGRNLADYF